MCTRTCLVRDNETIIRIMFCDSDLSLGCTVTLCYPLVHPKDMQARSVKTVKARIGYQLPLMCEIGRTLVSNRVRPSVPASGDIGKPAILP